MEEVRGGGGGQHIARQIRSRLHYILIFAKYIGHGSFGVSVRLSACNTT